MSTRFGILLTALTLGFATYSANASETREEKLSRALAKESEARIQVSSSDWILIRDPRLASEQLSFTVSDSVAPSSPLLLSNVTRLQVRRDSGTKGALLGGFFVGGFCAMLGAGIAQMDETAEGTPMGEGAMIGGALGAVVGATMGFLIGESTHHWSTVYERHEESR